jgi:hypothetical protein
MTCIVRSAFGGSSSSCSYLTGQPRHPLQNHSRRFAEQLPLVSPIGVQFDELAVYTGGVLMGDPRREEVAIDLLECYGAFGHRDPAVLQSSSNWVIAPGIPGYELSM